MKIDRDDELRDAYRERRTSPSQGGGCLHITIAMVALPVGIVSAVLWWVL